MTFPSGNIPAEAPHLGEKAISGRSNANRDALERKIARTRSRARKHGCPEQYLDGAIIGPLDPTGVESPPADFTTMMIGG